MGFWNLAPGDTGFLQATEINHEPPWIPWQQFAEFVAIADNNKTGWWILFLWNYICIHIDIIHNVYIYTYIYIYYTYYTYIISSI